MKQVDFRKLGFAAKAGICWSFFWRGITITIGSMLLGGVLGAVFGFIFGMAGSAAGLPKHTVVNVAQGGGFILGLAAGVFFLYVYIRWLLGSRLGAYRLILVSADEKSRAAFQATAPSSL